MNSSILLITLSGDDRPGIVSKVADKIHAHQGNWEHSRLVHLAGRFVGLLQVSVADRNRDALREDLLSIEGLDLTIAHGRSQSHALGTSFQIHLVGADHPGIVREVFGSLAALGLNVESMSTHTEAAADSGIVLFRVSASLSSAEAMSESTVREQLEGITHDLLVEVSQVEPGEAG